MVIATCAMLVIPTLPYRCCNKPYTRETEVKDCRVTKCEAITKPFRPTTLGRSSLPSRTSPTLPGCLRQRKYLVLLECEAFPIWAELRVRCDLSRLGIPHCASTMTRQGEGVCGRLASQRVLQSKALDAERSMIVVSTIESTSSPEQVRL